MEEVKVKAVLDWLVPKLVKDIQKFLGLANYYRRFIKGFAKIARPLHEFIKDHWICNLYEVVVKEPEVDIVKKIKKARNKDEEVVRVVEEMKKVGVRSLREDKWEINGRLILKEENIYIQNNEELRVEIIWLHHDILVAGHGGRWKTMELVIRNYWWLGVTKDIEKYMEECDMCQRMKNRTETPAGKLIMNKIPEKL